MRPVGSQRPAQAVGGGHPGELAGADHVQLQVQRQRARGGIAVHALRGQGGVQAARVGRAGRAGLDGQRAVIGGDRGGAHAAHVAQRHQQHGRAALEAAVRVLRARLQRREAGEVGGHREVAHPRVDLEQPAPQRIGLGAAVDGQARGHLLQPEVARGGLDDAILAGAVDHVPLLGAGALEQRPQHRLRRRMRMLDAARGLLAAPLALLHQPLDAAQHQQQHQAHQRDRAHLGQQRKLHLSLLPGAGNRRRWGDDAGAR